MLSKVRRATASLAGRRGLATGSAQPRVVLVDGVRTPFHRSGTVYNKYISQELGKFAMQGLIARTGMAPTDPDAVIYGTVIQEVRTSNIAREAALAAGISNSVPAHTVTLACISSNVAMAEGAMMIKTGQADSVVVGGTETMSDAPIRFSKPMRQALIKASRAKSIGQVLGIFSKVGLAKMFTPEAPAIAEFSTGEIMGHSSDRLAAMFGVTRAEQDQFAFDSHQKAAKAHADGLLANEICAVDGHTVDNGIKADTTLEKLNSLKPAFVKPHGTHTAANSSYLTDGASAALIMREDKALAMGYKPLAAIKDWMFVSQDPKDQLLLGPAYASTRLLRRNGVEISDVGVFEFHEAFAGQVLANLRAMDSDEFTRNEIGDSKGKLGEIPMDKLNTLGGSLSLGHPFGATGTRLVTTASNRMNREGAGLALVAACAAGGQGVSMLLEPIDA